MGKTLNRARPYASVYGQPGALFEQDGVLFNAGGEPVIESTLIPCEDAPEPPAIETYEPLVLTVVVDDKPTHEETPDLSSKHWKHLKVMVEAYGGEWTNKEDAVLFLKGKAA